MAARAPSLALYAAVGTVAGLFSALFGVGGGLVIVPLLLAFAAFDPRRATATSLAAILFTAIYGSLRYEWSGRVHWADAALIGLPACAGVLAGTGLQRRVSSDQLLFLFALLMAGIGVKLIIG